MKRLLIYTLLLLAPIQALAKSPPIHRSQAVLREFQKLHPCPRPGPGTCFQKGYVIDHVQPLACGGRDDPSNMAWQTIEEAKAKDKIERIGCGPGR